MPKRTLVIPEYNEGRTIVNVLERSYPYADLIIVVNDGSTDASGSLVQDWAADHPGVVLLTLTQNQGMSGALLVGFCHVLRLVEAGLLNPDDVVINIDADGQHLPEEIPGALESMLASGADVLLGRRNLDGYPWFKHIGNWGLSLWASMLGGTRYRDVECGFRLMRIEVLADLVPFFTGRRYGCAQEIGVITARRGWKINNRFPTQIAYYRAGARVRDGVTNLWMGLKAFVRVVLGRRYPMNVRMNAVLGMVADPPDAVSFTPWTASS
jgi:glycosyltransferase involved in cell wall biosynthesis